MLRTGLIASVPELLARHAAARGGKLAYEDARGKVTYRELAVRTANLAGHLAGLGLEPGQRVAMLLPNSVAWIETCLAINRAAGVSVPIAYESTEPEIAYRLTDAGCRVIVTTREKAALVAALRPSAPDLAHVILLDTSTSAGGSRTAAAGATTAAASCPDAHDLARLLSTAPPSAPRDDAGIEDAAFIVYTSGTTGRAKGVLLSVHGMLWVAAACWAPICGLSDRDVVLSPLPLFHSYALNLSVLSILATGASEYIMERWSTAEALSLMRSGRFTMMPGVPTMFHYLMQRAKEEKASAAGPSATRRGFPFGVGKPRPVSGQVSGPSTVLPGVKLPGVKMCISAGAIMPATLNREFEAYFGVPLLDGYGITETSTMVTMNWPQPPDLGPDLGADADNRILGSCGLPLPGLAVRIVDPVSSTDAAPGAEGELIVRGPNVMLGYHDKPSETAAALRDGWYRTGDLARADANGFLTITGRLKELIIRGGQNIAPAEIEEAVNTFAPVLDCAVVGMPHAELGEVAVLFVVPRPGATIAGDAVLDHCRQRLSAYKVPHAVHVVSEIPRTGSGKIIRYKLREGLSPGTQATAATTVTAATT